ncbi:MAG: recombinase family protein [Clostridiaceae bacterium]|nr:recombinase family protein [Clostridiaceae bacterium]
MKAVAYARFSSDEQRQESITAQLRAISYYAQQKGIEIVRVYSDEAKSARTDRRPDFLRMISDSARHDFEIVLIHKYDRFSRNMEDALYYERMLRGNGVKVISIIEQLGATPEDQLLKALLFGMNQFYSANLSREVMKGLKENAYACKSTGGASLGYDVGPDGRYIINAREAEAVRLIFRLYTSGVGYGGIIDTLNAQGYLTKRGMPYKLLRPNRVHACFCP